MTTPRSCSGRRIRRLAGARPDPVYASAAEVLARINPTVGVVEAIDEHTCVLVTGADSVEIVAVYIGMLGLDFTVTEPPELVAHLATLAKRYASAIRPAN